MVHPSLFPLPSSPSYKMHQLDRVAGRHRHVAQRGPADDAAIVLDHDGAGIELELIQDLEQRGATRDLFGLSIDYDIDQLRHAISSSRILRAAAAGSASSHSARIAATPYAPLPRTSR